MRRPVQAQAQGKGRVESLPAPTRGWIENENLAKNGGAGAMVLENWFPETSTVRLRGGSMKRATIGSDPVEGLIAYEANGIAKLFAASDSDLYDISALNPTIAPLAVWTGLGSGRFSYVQIDTGGGQFLVMVNGADPALYYDGAAWNPIAITGVDTATLSHIWAHANRLWAVQGGTMKAWYMPVDQIGGAAVSFNLGGVFQRGGSLLFGGTWSGDSGTGMADRCVFVSDHGEIAVYEGTDPATAATWSLTGRYDIGRPVTSQTMRAGGDLLLATTDGLVPLSQIVVKDPAALSMAAVSYPIDPAWHRVMASNDAGIPVQLMKWAAESMGIVGYPHKAGKEAHVVNLTTGAWARWTGLDIQCMALHTDLAFYGDGSGNIFQIEAAGADNGAPYVARFSGLPHHLRAPGAYKAIQQARATFRYLVPFEAKLSVATDYGKDFPTAPSAAPDGSVPAVWDAGLWDEAQWDDAPDSEARVTRTTQWQSVGRSGFSVSPQVQVTCAGNRRPDAELVALDVLYHPGGTVV